MADFQMWSALQSAMQDDGARRRVDRATWRRVLAFARPHRRTIVAFLALATVSALLGVLTPVLAGRAVDAIVDQRAAGAVVGIAVALAVIAVVGAGVGLLERLASSRLGERLILDLRRRVFEHVQSMPIAFFTRTRTGALVSRLNNDVIGAQGAFTSALAGVVTNVITLVLTLAVMFSLSWPITALALTLLPLFVIPARRIGARVGQLEREATEHNAAMTSQMTERFSAPGATLVKLFGRPRAEAAEFGRRAERVSDIGVRSAMAMETFFRSLTLVSGLAQALVYGLGGYLAVRGRLDPGTIVTMALLLNQLYGPLTALGTARLDVVTALVSFERVFEVLDLEPLIAEPAAPVDLPDGPVAVELAGVRFAYPSADRVSLASLEEVAVLDDRAGEEVLHDISFRVEAGRTVALVGPSGAGKSTLAALVPRLYDPDAGVVRLAGVDVRDLSFDTIRATVGVVTQDGHLFHDTIAANLRYAAPGATDGDLWDALEQARLGALVRSLPDGLATVVGERGYRLSGGERQRLTIARLLLAQPRVVILDEATAHLDSQSEAAVQEALVAALAGRTAIVIAHRLSTIRAADEILVVDGGRIVERGSHGHLLASGGRYAALHRTQFEEPTVEAVA
ncbi:MAG TPA: ABC transporter ATP-binding protein [Ilumatobacteraceae bacterium]|nr:ABC transporter ATP-binding protein [Ilumatobacteraceae bacterium]